MNDWKIMGCGIAVTVIFLAVLFVGSKLTSDFVVHHHIDSMWLMLPFGICFILAAIFFIGGEMAMDKEHEIEMRKIQNERSHSNL